MTPGVPIESDYLTYREAAELIGLSVGGIHAAIRRNALHPTKDAPGTKQSRLLRAEVLLYAREHGRALHEPARPIGMPSANMAYLEELRIKSDMFRGIAGNVATQARLAVQPVANPGQVSALLGLLFHQLVDEFMKRLGADRLARIESAGAMDAEDIRAMFAAGRGAIEAIAAAPLTANERDGWAQFEALMSDMARRSAVINTSASSPTP
jgi:hypothetical protein